MININKTEYFKGRARRVAFSAAAQLFLSFAYSLSLFDDPLHMIVNVLCGFKSN
jgi:hypothetical protein